MTSRRRRRDEDDQRRHKKSGDDDSGFGSDSDDENPKGKKGTGPAGPAFGPSLYTDVTSSLFSLLFTRRTRIFFGRCRLLVVCACCLPGRRPRLLLSLPGLSAPNLCM